jgi:3-methyladenine DNA glycosylase Tag
LSTTSIIDFRFPEDVRLQPFSVIYEKAAARKGGADALETLLPKPKSAAQLNRIGDDRYLAEMTKCVFRSGFVWQIIEHKWPGFEAAFDHFDTAICAMLSDEDLERLGQDERIVRHGKKIASVRGNAQFVRQVKDEHGGFGRYLTQWPDDDIVGLWDELKRRGQRLGGNTGPFFLRFMGRDTFMLSPDVVTALIRQKVIDKAPSSKRALASVQAAFNAWRADSGRSMAEISRTLSYTVG